ncbi:DUF2306 domain-containing protein [Hymenobacter aerilatus]|uniref:DUF2306 domain-containing protein n=1 Tax=Hymenobacter aerilatus TaxID=2932251 RepID=A0A8T9T3N0_9BACT|nr:DUF2306 domain-containing protein [Hymenobacter aerilatus]UOR07573.1 DUF2306 domain-containing protein [Hymenobacter aerilatus]
MFHSATGLIHLLSALLAMLTGAMVLLNRKGGHTHKRLGYAYVACMLVLNATAFMIYHLFGTFGPFHALSIVSLTVLTGGILPMWWRVKNALHWHYYFMNWSVVGLYAAFWAETLTRTLPSQRFWPMVLVATVLTATVGSLLIRRNAARFLPKKTSV